MTNIFQSNKLKNKCKKILRPYKLQLLLTFNLRAKQLRKRAFKMLEQQVTVLAKEGYIEDIVLGIATKKAEIISRIFTTEELGILNACSYPHYNGTQYVSSVPEQYYIPEEECIHWVSFFAAGQTSRAGSQRYFDVLAMVFPEAEKYELQDLQNNKLKRRRMSDRHES